MMNPIPFVQDAQSPAVIGAIADSHTTPNQGALSPKSGEFKEIMAKLNTISKNSPNPGETNSGSTMTAMTDNGNNTPELSETSEPLATAKQPLDDQSLFKLAFVIQQLPQDIQQLLKEVLKQVNPSQMSPSLQELRENNSIVNNISSDDNQEIRQDMMGPETALELAALWLTNFNMSKGMDQRQNNQENPSSTVTIRSFRDISVVLGSPPDTQIFEGNASQSAVGKNLQPLEPTPERLTNQGPSDRPSVPFPSDILEAFQNAASFKSRNDFSAFLSLLTQNQQHENNNIINTPTENNNQIPSENIDSLPPNLLEAFQNAAPFKSRNDFSAFLSLLTQNQQHENNNIINTPTENNNQTPFENIDSLPPNLLEAFQNAASSDSHNDFSSFLSLLTQNQQHENNNIINTLTENNNQIPSENIDSLPPNLLEAFQNIASSHDKELQTILFAQLLQKDISTQVWGASSHTNEITDATQKGLVSYPEMINKDIDKPENDISSGTDGSKITLTTGNDQAKNSHNTIEQSVFADLKDANQKPQQRTLIEKGTPNTQEKSASAQITNLPNDESNVASSKQPLEDDTKDNFAELQQTIGDPKTIKIDTHSMVIRKNVGINSVTKEIEGMISKGMESGHTLPKRVVLYLNPPELGRVKVDMLLDAGNQLSVNFVTEHVEVRSVLEGHMEQLKGHLVQKGLDVSELRVEAGGFADFASLEQGFNQGTPQDRWDSFKTDWNGMVSAKKMIEEENSAPPKLSNSYITNGRLHLII